MAGIQIPSNNSIKIDQEIESLGDYLSDAEMYPEQIEAHAKLRRTVYLFLLRRHVRNRTQQLYLRRRTLQNSYPYIH